MQVVCKPQGMHDTRDVWGAEIMDDLVFKEGLDIYVSVGDISFKGKIHSTDEPAKSIAIEVPLPWMNSLSRTENGSRCNVLYKTAASPQYNITGASSVIETRFTVSPPLLIIRFPGKTDKRRELRKYERIAVSLFTDITHREKLGDGYLLDKPRNGTIVDMSLGGCLILADSNFKIEDFLVLNFSIREGEVLKIRCRVRNKRPFYESGLHLYGLEFETLDNAIKGALDNFITPSS